MARGDSNIGSWLRRHGALDGGKAAIVFESQNPLSYAQLDKWVDAAAGQLQTRYGIGKGERVAYLGMNDPAIIVLLFACARLGALLVPVNWRLAPAEISFIVADCKPKVVFYGPAFAETGEDAAQSIGASADPCEEVHAWRGGEGDFEETGRIDDPVLIVYTSGTTGRPKGAVLSQRAIFVNALNSLDMHEMRRSDKILVLLPLFHVGGLNIQLTPALYAGATVYLHASFDPAAAYKAIARVQPDLLVLVPAMMAAMIELPEWKTADFSSLRCLTTGSSLVPVDLIASFEARSVPVIQIYGSSETCPIAVYQRPGEGATHPKSTGKAALHTKIRLVVRLDQIISDPDIDGEIEILGDHVMDGYWRNEAATRDSFHDGWFRTGDIAHMDGEGNVYFQERQTNLIISGGENIYPAEIERIIQVLENVIEVSVVGMPDDKWGAVPVAAVVVAKNGPDEAAIRAVLEAHLARYKLPRKIVFFETLPRNAMGKIVAGQVKMLLLKLNSAPFQ